MFWKILAFLLFHQALNGICHMIHASGKIGKFVFVVILDPYGKISL